VHTNLADYYLGKWGGGVEKPFTHTPEIVVRLKLVEGRAKACRHVPDMPLVFGSCEPGTERFNLRKMSQLPYSLLRSGQADLLRSTCLCK
jgi:hypothetical protein